MNNGKKSDGTTEVLEFQFPVKKESQSFGQILYNSKTGAVLGRTPKNWAQLGLFYTIFYAVLAAMFSIFMQGLFSTLSDTEPKWKLDKSLIGTNPGLGFRPLSDETERGSVIQFDTKKPEEGRYWKELLDEFFQDYQGEGRKGKFCNFNQTHKPDDVCIVDTQAFGPCSPENEYGYKNGRPCVFLKLNKIFSWAPEYYDDPNNLPEDMPKELKQHISNTSQLERQQIWVSCKGQHSADEEIIGPVSYYPRQGFPAFYYPFTNQPGYLSPLIAVQFENLSVGRMINVECRAWAKNIIYSGSIRDRQGSVSFNLFMD